MSTDQPELSDFGADEAAARHAQALAQRGAEYGPSDAAAASAPQQEPENVCKNCEHEIPSHVARVVGDNNGCVPGCKHCREDWLTDVAMSRGVHATTVRLVRVIRSEGENHNITGGSQ